MNHGSLFSGIGGFDLASKRVGWKNIFQVEIEEKARKILQKHFPDTQRYADIKDFDGRQYARHIDIISGGFPCQPFSAAGKRKGSADDRAIWFEMFRVVSEIRPRWVVAENVSGLLTIESGMAFERVCTDLESEGYAVQSFIIPACAVGAPHRRNRVWIVAHQNTNSGTDGRIEAQRRQKQHRHAVATDEIRTSPNTGRKQTRAKISGFNCQQQISTAERKRTSQGHGLTDSSRTSPNTAGERLQKGIPGRLHRHAQRHSRHHLQPFWRRSWLEVATELCRVDDGLPGRLDRFKHLGNAIVPQVAQAIFSAINEYEGIEI